MTRQGECSGSASKVARLLNYPKTCHNPEYMHGQVRVLVREKNGKLRLHSVFLKPDHRYVLTSQSAPGTGRDGRSSG